jgi:coenzyme F420-reducing hydrogenase gamma subunit
MFLSHSKSVLKLSCAAIVLLTLGACANDGYVPAHRYSNQQCKQMHMTGKITLEQKRLCFKGVEFRENDPDFADKSKQQ